MNRVAKREFSHYFAPGKKLFQIVVKITDEPGSLDKILNLLGTRVNLVGTTSYTMRDNTAIVTGFAEALSQDETAEKLRKLITSSSVALEAEVSEGQDGILVDTFHTGLETDGEHLMLFRRSALARMFDRVYKLLGSGGEVLLFEEGEAIGRANGEAFVKILGAEKVRQNMSYLRNNLAAQGWGRVTAGTTADGGTTSIQIHDCFECSSNEGERTGCHFFRGYIVGNRSATYGQDLSVEEVKCSLKGDDVCEFRMRPKTQ